MIVADPGVGGQPVRVELRELADGPGSRWQVEQLEQPLGGLDQLGVDRMLAPVRFGTVGSSSGRVATRAANSSSKLSNILVISAPASDKVGRD
jgi:hypothetical protein